MCADIDGPKIIVVSSTHTLERTASNCNDPIRIEKTIECQQ